MNKRGAVLKIATLCILLIMGLTACTGESSSNSGLTAGSSYEGATVGSSYDGATADSSHDGSLVEGFNANSATDESNDSSSNDVDTAEKTSESNSESTDTTDKDIEKTEKTDLNSDKTNSNNIKLVDEKLIYKCSIEIETLDFDKSYDELQKLMNKFQCIIGSEQFSNSGNSLLNDEYNSSINNGYKESKSDTIVIRVPSKKYKEFINSIGNIGNVLHKETSVDNITTDYYDTTAQVDGLEVQLNTLKDIMKQTKNVNELITLNKEIADLQNQINQLKTRLRTMDADVAYSYVTIELKEVVEYTVDEKPQKQNTFIDRLKKQCSDTWKGFLKFLEVLLFTIIALLPTIVVLGIIWIIIRITCRNKIKAWKENRKLRKTSGSSSMSELNTLLKYDENKINSEVDTDESKNKQ